MVAAGRVSGLFGAKGEVSLVLFDAFPHDFDTEEPVFVKIDAHTVPLFFDNFSRRGARGATALFADINTEGRASELVGLEFSVRGYEDDEQDFEDFVGWTADFGSELKGRIAGFVASEVNPLFEVEMRGAGYGSVSCAKSSGSSSGSAKKGSGSESTLSPVPVPKQEPGSKSGSSDPVLIPAVDEFIREIDEKRRKIVFELPEGLLELNT